MSLPLRWSRRDRADATDGTTLPGSRELDDSLSTSLHRGTVVTLALLQVDGLPAFRLIHGQDATERLLATVTQELRTVEDAEVFRLHDGRFALVFALPPHLAESHCDRLTQLPRRATACIGLAQARQGEHPAGLGDRAEGALREARRRGTGTIGHAPASSEHELELTAPRAEALLALIRGGDIRVHYQPIVGLQEGELLGYEAFPRPQLSQDLAGPNDAFEIAERLQLIQELDALCRRSVFADGPGYDMPSATRLHLNISPFSLGHRSLGTTRLQNQVREAGLEASRVVFELREHPSCDLALVADELQTLRSLGFRIALDDVGAGGTSLLARRLGELDLLKIAPAVTAGVGRDRRADAVLEAVCAYAGRTGAAVIATGVESKDELRALKAWLTRTPHRSLIAAQGYHLGPPTPQPGSRRTDEPEETEEVTATS